MRLNGNETSFNNSKLRFTDRQIQHQSFDGFYFGFGESAVANGSV